MANRVTSWTPCTAAGELAACPNPNSFNGANCKRRGCPYCGPRWARQLAVWMKANLHALDRPVVVVAITAPGADVLPWACGKDHVHSGKRGCRVKEDAADVWAEHCRDNWRQLRDAARLRCKRAGMEPAWLVERVWEPQKRGVPHLHVVLPFGTELEKIAAHRFVGELHELAPEYLFGFVDRKLKPIGAAEAARYLVGYLMGRRRRKSGIRENIADPRMPRSLTWMTPRLTMQTLVTMRRLRTARWFRAARRHPSSTLPCLAGQELVDIAFVLAVLDGVDDANAPPIATRASSYRRELQLMRRVQRERNGVTLSSAPRPGDARERRP